VKHKIWKIFIGSKIKTNQEVVYEQKYGWRSLLSNGTFAGKIKNLLSFKH